MSVARIKWADLFLIFLITAAILSIQSPSQAEMVSIEAVNLVDRPILSRLVLSLSAATTYEVLPRLGEKIVLVKIHDVAAIGVKKIYRVKDGVVHSVSFDNYGGSASVRISLRRGDLYVTHYPLEDPHRIVLEFTDAPPLGQGASRSEPISPVTWEMAGAPTTPSSGLLMETDASAYPQETGSQNSPQSSGSTDDKVVVEGDREDEKLFQKSLTLMDRGEHKSALKVMKTMGEKYPGSDYAEATLFNIGDALFMIEDLKDNERYMKAIDAFNNAMREYPSSGRIPHALFLIGKSYENLGIYYEAGAYFSRLISDYPHNDEVGEAYFRLGEVKYKDGDIEGAITYLMKVIKEFPQADFVGEALYRLGDSKYRQNDMFNALSYYEKGLQNFPSQILRNPGALFNMGDIYFQNEEYQKARQTLLKAVNLFPKWEGSDVAMAKIGDSHFQKGDLERAGFFYAMTIANYPDSEGAMLSRVRMADLGIHKLNLKKLNLAQEGEAYEKLLYHYIEVVENSDFPEISELALLKLGEILLDLKQNPRSIAIFKKLVKEYPKGILNDRSLSSMRKVLKEYINFKYDNRDFLSVINLFQDYSEMAFKGFIDPQLYFQVGDSYQQLGLYDKALELLTRVLESEPNNSFKARVTFMAGRLSLLTGDYERARQNLTRYVTKYPHGSLIQRAQKLLGDVARGFENYRNASEYYLDSLTHVGEENRKAQAYYYLAGSFRKLGAHDAAVSSYRKVEGLMDGKKIETESPYYLHSGRFMLADGLFEAERYPEALMEYGEAVKAFPRDERVEWALYRMGRSYEELGSLSEAMGVYRKLTEEGKDGFWVSVALEKFTELSWRADLEGAFK